MANATIVSQMRNRAVVGSLRTWMGTVTIANNGDTLTVPGMHVVKGVSVDSSSTSAIGATLSTNVITFVSGGALSNILVTAFGY